MSARPPGRGAGAPRAPADAPDSRRATVLVLAASLAAWLVGAALAWVPAPPLGHDEAQYAIAGRDVLAGEPARWGYLSIGMNAVSIPGLLAGGGEHALRALPVLLGVAFALAAAAVARAAVGGAVAAWTVAVLAASYAIARRASELLSDLPAAACLLAGTAILVGELAREPAPRRRLLLAAPCLAAAFYLRYGSVLPIAALAAAALAAGWRASLRRPWLAAATVGLFALLLVPHLAAARAATGSALGVLRASSDAVADADGRPALWTYLTVNPFRYYGVVTVPVVLAGLAAIRRARDRRVRLLWLAAVGDVILVGLTPVAQPRYVFFGIALLAILGVDEIRRWLAARGPRSRRLLGQLAAAAVVASWVTVVISLSRLDTWRRDHMERTLAAIAAIRADARGAPCEVIARRTTQLQWYTGCVAVYEADAATLARARVYLVHEPTGTSQPPLEGRVGVPRPVLAQPDVTVTRYDPPPPPAP